MRAVAGAGALCAPFSPISPGATMRTARAMAPLRRSKDAIGVDTTGMACAEQQAMPVACISAALLDD